ncbi:hypothetical protein [Legionella sp. 16cNR16C]|uniref:hypothetical protein n=1 Tax=Legionella sp. 16cNR16C TaxID=2905656 RepID=UPI001E38AA4E|nr:hypothetical protein [Legionella sp. 16cNR16C]MCE3044704.1 hypothetical protein [Legionella sp. 16cNR16C]
MPFTIPSYETIKTMLKYMDASKGNSLKERQEQDIEVIGSLIKQGNLAQAIEKAKFEQTANDNHYLMFQLVSIMREVTYPPVEQTYRSEAPLSLSEKIGCLVIYRPVDIEQLKELYQTIPASSEYYERSQKQITAIQATIDFRRKSNDLAEELNEKDQERTVCPLACN